MNLIYKLLKFIEDFFISFAGMASPFIIMANYFNNIPYDNRNSFKSLLFLITSVVYALFYIYLYLNKRTIK